MTRADPSTDRPARRRQPRRGAGIRCASALVVVLALLAPACGRPPRVDPDAFLADHLAPQVALWRQLGSLTAYGELELETGGRRVAGRVRALAVRPGRLRIDAELPGFFGLLGGTATLWADHQGVRWTTSSEPELYDATADPVFGELLGVVPTARDLEVLLFGLPAWWWPAGRFEETSSGEHNPKQEWELRGHPAAGVGRLRWPSGRYEVGWIGEQPPVLEVLERGDAGGTRVMVSFDAYRTVDALRLPGRLRVRAPNSGDRLEIRWRRFQADAPGAAERLEWPPR
ncbi:MAG: hypothetical protein PVF43_02720 [Candidatus Eiseniibacteriota bacterium]|jgi:hypothetical protein